MPNYLVFKKDIYVGINIFNTLPPSLTILNNGIAKFKAACRKYLNTHPFYPVDRYVMCKDDL